jgi:hypothetical protein
MAAERVKRLKDLIEAVMRLPDSPDRERLLSEVRSRAVDLDTGVVPRAMLPMREPMPAAMAPTPRPKRRTVLLPPQPARPAPARHSQADWGELLGGTAHLSLDDSPQQRDGDRAARPWTLGLRG